MPTNLYTVRDQLNYAETHTPEHCAAATGEYHKCLNAHGRPPLRGHRTTVTPSVLADSLPQLLTGGFGLGAQLAAYRRVAPIKAKTPGPWKKAATDVLADLGQLIDEKLERSRAERIAQDAVPIALPMVQGWLESESA